MSQIQKARKTLKTSQGIKYPADEEISKLTGYSLKKIRAANQCLKVVGSIDKKVGDCFTTKFLVCPFEPTSSLINCYKKYLVLCRFKLFLHGFGFVSQCLFAVCVYAGVYTRHDDGESRGGCDEAERKERGT